MSPMPKKVITPADVAANKAKLAEAEKELADLVEDRAAERKKLYRRVVLRVAKYAFGERPVLSFELDAKGNKILVPDMERTWQARQPVIKLARMIKNHEPDGDIMAALIEFLIAETDRIGVRGEQWDEVKQQWTEVKEQWARKKKKKA